MKSLINIITNLIKSEEGKELKKACKVAKKVARDLKKKGFGIGGYINHLKPSGKPTCEEIVWENTVLGYDIYMVIYAPLKEERWSRMLGKYVNKKVYREIGSLWLNSRDYPDIMRLDKRWVMLLSNSEKPEKKEWLSKLERTAQELSQKYSTPIKIHYRSGAGRTWGL